jgi:hypothetical protein
MEIVGHSAIEMTMDDYGHVQLSTQCTALHHLDDEAVVIKGRYHVDRNELPDREPAGENGWS